MIQHLCDACKVKLSAMDIMATREHADSLLREAPQLQRVMGEEFCPKHLREAREFWTAKLAEVSEAGKVFEDRVTKFCNRFWTARLNAGGQAGQIKAVVKSGTHG